LPRNSRCDPHQWIVRAQKFSEDLGVPASVNRLFGTVFS